MSAAEDNTVSPARALEKAAPALLERALEIEEAGTGERLVATLGADTKRLIEQLVAAVAAGRPQDFAAQVQSARTVLEQNGIRAELVDAQLKAVEMALTEHTGPWVDSVRDVLRSA